MQSRWITCRWQACERLRGYATVGLSLTALGLGLMYVLVSHAGTNPYVTQAVLVPVLMWTLTYVLHRQCVFDDTVRPGSSHFKKWVAVKVGGATASRLSFPVLVAVFGVPYLVASLVITASLAGPSYLLIRDWVFGPKIDKA